jgi:hypothetical protein
MCGPLYSLRCSATCSLCALKATPEHRDKEEPYDSNQRQRQRGREREGFLTLCIADYESQRCPGRPVSKRRLTSEASSRPEFPQQPVPLLRIHRTGQSVGKLASKPAACPFVPTTCVGMAFYPFVEYGTRSPCLFLVCTGGGRSLTAL